MIYLLCIILPPLAVLLSGRPGSAVLNLLLTVCLWIPGVIHAILVVNDVRADRRNQKMVEAVRESGRPPQ